MTLGGRASGRLHVRGLGSREGSEPWDAQQTPLTFPSLTLIKVGWSRAGSSRGAGEKANIPEEEDSEVCVILPCLFLIHTRAKAMLSAVAAAPGLSHPLPRG